MSQDQGTLPNCSAERIQRLEVATSYLNSVRESVATLGQLAGLVHELGIGKDEIGDFSSSIKEALDAHSTALKRVERAAKALLG